MSRPCSPLLLALIAVLAAPVAAGAAPSIAEVLGRGMRGDAGGVSRGTALFRVRLDGQRFPRAVCNDGSGAVFYVRAASRLEDRDKWILYLQGGGSCEGYDTCAERWRSRDTHFGADKMSTAAFPAPAGIRGGGILSPDRDNALRGWNAVFLYYCSSDTWAGQASDVTLEDPAGAGAPYALHFEGGSIVDAVLATLQREAGPVRYGRKPDAGASRLVTMPDLRDATDVLLTGSSAGGNGTKHNADRVGELLRASNRRCNTGQPCPLRYRAVIDAAFGPDAEAADWGECREPEPCAGYTYDSFFAEKYEEIWLGTYHGRLDASCLSWHQDTAHDPRQEVWRCADPSHVGRHHLTTPFFARKDLLDDNSLPWAFGSDGDFAAAVHDQLAGLADLDATAEEGGALTAPGVFGPKCGQHVGLDNDKAYFSVHVWDASGGTSHTFQDVLLRWLSGGSPQQWIEGDTTPRVWPRCASGAVPCC